MARPKAKPGIPFFEPKRAIKAIRVGWLSPSELNTSQRRRCVDVMYYEHGMSGSAIADFMQVNDTTLRLDLKTLDKQAGRAFEAKGTREILLGRFLRGKMAIYSRAMAKGDLANANRAITELLDRAMDIGVVRREPREIKGSLDLLTLLSGDEQEDMPDVPSKSNGKGNGAGLEEV